MPSERLDQFLSNSGHAEGREQAKRLIMAGKVRVNGQVVDKASFSCKGDETIEVESPPRFVSRGGEKLQGAIEAFGLNPDHDPPAPSNSALKISSTADGGACGCRLRAKSAYQ